MLGWEVCTSCSPVWSEPEHYWHTQSGEESHGVVWEYLIHMEIAHCSFKIHFPSFKSDRGFLQLIHGHCLRKLGELLGLDAEMVGAFWKAKDEQCLFVLFFVSIVLCMLSLIPCPFRLLETLVPLMLISN